MKALSLSIRFALFVFGLLLFLTIAPHANPWKLVYVNRVFENTPGVAIRLFGTSLTVTLSEPQFITCAVVFLLVLLIASLWNRRLLSHPLPSKGLLVSSILSLELFVFTLIPVNYDIVHDAKSVVIFLVLGMISFACCSFGLSRFMEWVLDRFQFSARIDDLWETVKRKFVSVRLPLFLGTLVLLNFALTNLASYYLFSHIPHVEDSIGQFFHSKIFSLGKLSVPSPPHPEFFHFTHVIDNGQWYSQYPAGHVFLLMLGLLFGTPWLINPLFGSLTLIPLYALGRELYGEVVGRAAAVFALLSPFLVFMSSEFMSHTTALFFFVVFLLFFVKALRTGKALSGFLSGSALGWLVNIRPYTAAAISLPFLLYGGVMALRDRRRLKSALIAFSSSFAVFVALLLLFNTLTNGHPLLFGYDVLWGTSGRPGFAQSAWGPEHTPLRGLLQTLSNLNALNKYLFEWPVPSLFFVMLLFMSGRGTVWDYLSLAAFGSVVLAYFLYWFQDWCFGPRFLFEPAGLLILLTVRGMQNVPNLLHDLNFTKAPHSKIHLISILLVMLFFVAGHASNLPSLVENYGNKYWHVSPRSIEIVREAGITRSVVFTQRDYGEVFPQNSPLLDGDIIFVRDRGLENKNIMEEFKGYDSFLLTKEKLVRLEIR